MGIVKKGYVSDEGIPMPPKETAVEPVEDGKAPEEEKSQEEAENAKWDEEDRQQQERLVREWGVDTSDEASRLKRCSNVIIDPAMVVKGPVLEKKEDGSVGPVEDHDRPEGKRKRHRFSQHAHLDYFLRLKCAPDVLAAVGKILNPAKEITEAVSLARRIRPLLIKEPMRWTVLDLCAGNGLFGVLVAHLLPARYVLAVDIQERGLGQEVKRYGRIKADIEKISTTHRHLFETPENPVLICSIHPCKGLAEDIIRIFNGIAPGVRCGLAMMPCCIGGSDDTPFHVKRHIGKYFSWSYYLARQVGGSVVEDYHNISPCRAIVLGGEVMFR